MPKYKHPNQIAYRTSGIFNVSKPYGITSMDVVRRIKRASYAKRVGHGGTLDPMATGVIPVGIGQATKLMGYMLDSTKKYRGTITLGVETDTYDSLGTVLSQKDPSNITFTDLERTVYQFKGNIRQIPPMFSALKKDGKRLYELARAGVHIEREPRHVKVFNICISEWTPPAITVEVSCSKGFYMRSLAYDLGKLLGCGGHLSSLTRLRSGPFSLKDSIALNELEQNFKDGTWHKLIHGPDKVLEGLPSLTVSKHIENDLNQGRPIDPEYNVTNINRNERCRVYTTNGRFLAVISFSEESGQWHPEQVFNISHDLEVNVSASR